MNSIEKFNPLNPIDWLEQIPIIGPILKAIFGCFSLQNIIVSIIPVLTLNLRNGNEGFLATIVVMIIFYLLSILGAVVLQYWKCGDSEKQKKLNFWDKTMNGVKGTWFIPMMFSIFMIINYIIRLPFLIEFREITFLLTFFIQSSFLFGLIMYIICFTNYCAFGVITC